MAYGTRSTPSSETLTGNARAPASRVEAQGRNDVLVWALSKVEDRNGNYLAISYAENNANGEFYPTGIYYTGNSTQGLTPTNHIQFVYEARTDIPVRYIGGSIVKMRQRLSHIYTYTGSSVVRDYQLSYIANASINTSQLTSITECVTTNKCLSPTSFDFGAGGSNTFMPKNTGPSTAVHNNSLAHTNSSISRVKFGDFNGDGRTDVYYINGGWGGSNIDTVYLSKDDGTYFPVNGPNTPINASTLDKINSYLSRIQFGDFNGDGMTDVYYINGGWGGSNIDTVFLSNGNGTFTPKYTGPATSINVSTLEKVNSYLSRVKFGDFNGDGRTDVYYVNGWDTSAADTVYLSNGNGTFTPKYTGPDTWVSKKDINYATSTISRVKFGDFNGDGMTDVYYINGASGYAVDTIYLSNGNGTFTPPEHWPKHMD